MSEGRKYSHLSLLGILAVSYFAPIMWVHQGSPTEGISWFARYQASPKQDAAPVLDEPPLLEVKAISERKRKAPPPPTNQLERFGFEKQEQQKGIWDGIKSLFSS